MSAFQAATCSSGYITQTQQIYLITQIYSSQGCLIYSTSTIYCPPTVWTFVQLSGPLVHSNQI